MEKIGLVNKIFSSVNSIDVGRKGLDRKGRHTTAYGKHENRRKWLYGETEEGLVY